MLSDYTKLVGASLQNTYHKHWIKAGIRSIPLIRNRCNNTTTLIHKEIYVWIYVCMYVCIGFIIPLASCFTMGIKNSQTVVWRMASHPNLTMGLYNPKLHLLERVRPL
jgi:hypothetical protein